MTDSVVFVPPLYNSKSKHNAYPQKCLWYLVVRSGVQNSLQMTCAKKKCGPRAVYVNGQGTWTMTLAEHLGLTNVVFFMCYDAARPLGSALKIAAETRSLRAIAEARKVSHIIIHHHTFYHFLILKPFVSIPNTIRTEHEISDVSSVHSIDLPSCSRDLGAWISPGPSPPPTNRDPKPNASYKRVLNHVKPLNHLKPS